MILTDEQIRAIEFLENPSRIKLLEGSAGTGKTTVIAEYCNRNNHHKILITAPTHKAVQVLSSKTSNECKTIHSYLKLKKELVGDKYKFVFQDSIDLEYYDVIAIDEASMIDNYLLDLILDKIHQSTKIIFIGDEKQLNPVNSPFSPVFKKVLNKFCLTEIIRHQNDIIDLSQNLRWLDLKKNGNNFTWVPTNSLSLEQLVKANGTDKFKFITWTNEIVGVVNKAVREIIYENPKQVEIGEVLLMRESFKEFDNNSEVVVKSAIEDEIYYNNQDILFPIIKTWVVNESMIIVHDDDLVKHNKNLEDLVNRAKLKAISWHDYYKYLETFAYTQYNHAITVHKSQGSTYDEALINISDIMRNRNIVERNRMLYTAVTRTKEHNYFI